MKAQPTTETTETLAREILSALLTKDTPFKTTYERVIREMLQPTFAKLTAAEKALGEILRMDQPYTSADTIQRLRDAGNLLFQKYDYRDDKWEEISLAIEQSEEILKALTLAKQHLSS